MSRHLSVVVIWAVGVQGQAPLGWVKLQRQVLGWLTPLGNAGGGCGAPPAVACNISALAIACMAAQAPARPEIECTWSPLLPATYIPGCPTSSDTSHTSSDAGCVSCSTDGCFPDFLSAQAACVSKPSCGGITSEINGPPWELRSLARTLTSPTNESSYVITNALSCGHAPPPPPPGSGCNAFDTNGNLFHCPGGRCDCDAGENACMRGLDIFSDDPSIGLGANDTDTCV
jgi:hypothetical protein